MVEIRPARLDELLELRDAALTPGHPGRPVIWPYDTGAEHLALIDDDRVIGCVSVTAQPMPNRSAQRPYHLHSMAIRDGFRGHGYGRLLLDAVLDRLQDRDADLVWATARPSAVEFYLRHGFVRGADLSISPTGAPMHYVWRTMPG